VLLRSLSTRGSFDAASRWPRRNALIAFIMRDYGPNSPRSILALLSAIRAAKQLTVASLSFFSIGNARGSRPE